MTGEDDGAIVSNKEQGGVRRKICARASRLARLGEVAATLFATTTFETLLSFARAKAFACSPAVPCAAASGSENWSGSVARLHGEKLPSRICRRRLRCPLLQYNVY
jgi:hypothetical protein